MVDLTATKMDHVITPEDYADIHIKYTGRHFNILRKESGLGLRNCKRMLDIGVGSGEITCDLAKLAPNADTIIGFDLSPDFVKYANATKTDERIQFYAHDAAKPYPDEWGKFDVVISSFTLVRIPEHLQEGVLNSIKNCLTPDGKVLITHFNLISGPHADIYKKVAHSEKWNKYIPEKYLLNLESQNPIWDKIDAYCDFVKSNGFKIISKGEKVLERCVGTRASGMKHLENNTTQQYIPEELKNEYWNDIFDSYPENVGKENDIIVKDLVSYVY